MSIAAQLLPEFDHEMDVTRTLLAVVPQDRLDWAPHERSMTLGRLTGHIANVLLWAVATMEKTHYDSGDPDSTWAAATFETTDGLLEIFDRNRVAARASIAAASDADMMVTWAYRHEGHEVFSAPRAGVLRGFVFNHGVHHRGQLSVYLRLLEVPLPSIYGPTADSPM